eukprot:365654-Chlamydomonas_euryale.AAC.7
MRCPRGSDITQQHDDGTRHEEGLQTYGRVPIKAPKKKSLCRVDFGVCTLTNSENVDHHGMSCYCARRTPWWLSLPSKVPCENLFVTPHGVTRRARGRRVGWVGN